VTSLPIQSFSGKQHATCVRCHRRLKHPIFVASGGERLGPFGSVCAKKMKPILTRSSFDTLERFIERS
jgi:hypothetical protein